MDLTATTLENGVLHVRLTGRLDLETTNRLEAPFTFQAASKAAPVVVDLGGLEFLGSLAIRLMLQAAKAQSQRGGRLVLYNPTPLVRQIFTTAGLGAVIPIHDNFDRACQDALAGCKKPAGPG